MTVKKLLVAGASGSALVALIAWPSGAARTSVNGSEVRGIESNAKLHVPPATSPIVATNNPGGTENESIAGADLESPQDDSRSDAALVQSIDEFVRNAPTLRDGAARLERFLEEPGNEELVGRLVRLVASGLLPEGASRQTVILAIAALPNGRFAAFKASLWKALDARSAAAAAAAAAEIQAGESARNPYDLARSLSLVGDAELRDVEFVRTVVALAASESCNFEVRRAAFDALASMRTIPEGAVASEIEQFLCDLLQRPLDGRLEVAAVRALAAQRGTQAAETLAEVLGDVTRMPAARRFAASGLHDQPNGVRVTRKLIDAHRSDSDSEVRNAALLSLGAHAARSGDALEELLYAVRSDSDIDGRRYAALALASVLDPRADAALDAAAASDPSPLVREVAAVALRAQRARARA